MADLALILYGGADFVLGSAILAGLVEAEVTDRAELIGHAFIWESHFAMWDAAPTAALALSHRAAKSSR